MVMRMKEMINEYVDEGNFTLLLDHYNKNQPFIKWYLFYCILKYLTMKTKIFSIHMLIIAKALFTQAKILYTINKK